MAYDPTSQNPSQNIFAYGGNKIDAQTGQITPVSSTINSGILNPSAPINYSTPNSTPIPSVPDAAYATPPLATTGPEKQAQDITTRLQGLNNNLVGKSAYQTSQEADAGLPDLYQQQTDLANQLTHLSNEAKAIPNQLQLDATGRGITAGGLQPIQTAALRNNAIKALGIFSLLDSIKGLIASAQDKANAAVSAKYDPIQEQINAATANLKLIQNSPEYTLADKNRAQAQLDVQKQKQDQLEKNKADATTIHSWAAAALANGATPLQAQEILKIGQSNNPDLNSAFSLYAPFSKDPNAVQKAINDLALQRAQIGLTQAQTVKAQADARKALSEAQVAAAGNVDVSQVISSIQNPNETRTELGGLTVNGLTQKAKVYLTNGGNIQGLGLSGKGNVAVQRQFIANYAGYLASQAGMDVPQITALYKANSKAAGEVISRIAKIDTTTNTLAGQFPRLAQLAANVGNLGITESDITAGKAAASRKFGSVDAGNFAELIQTVRGDYAAMQAAIGGSRGGEFFSRTAQDAIPLGLTPDQYLGLADTIRQSAAIAQQASGDEAKKLIGTTTIPSTATSTDQVVNGVTYSLGVDGLYYPKQ